MAYIAIVFCRCHGDSVLMGLWFIRGMVCIVEVDCIGELLQFDDHIGCRNGKSVSMHIHTWIKSCIVFVQTTQLSQQYTYENLTVCQWQRFICSLAVCAKTSWSGIWNAKICKVLSFPFVHYWSWTPCNTLLWKLDERKLYVKQKECSLMYHLALLLVFRKVWRYQRISHKL